MSEFSCRGRSAVSPSATSLRNPFLSGVNRFTQWRAKNQPLAASRSLNACSHSDYPHRSFACDFVWAGYDRRNLPAGGRVEKCGPSIATLPSRPPVLHSARNLFMRFLLAALCASVITAPILAADLLPPGTPIEQAIDHYIDAKLSEEGTSPAGQADDTTLIRRLTLDLVGRIPTAAES